MTEESPGPRTAEQTPAGHYLLLVQDRIRAIRGDIPARNDMGEKMARPILDGGRFFTPRVASFWPGEFGGRAGGFMGLTRRHDLHPSDTTDVAYIALPDPARWDAAGDETLIELLNSRAQIFVNGRPDELQALDSAVVQHVAAFTGGAPADLGLYSLGDRRPLAGLRHFDQFVRGWIAAGECIGALTRAGRMPTIFMSVLLEGAMVRNISFLDHHNKSVAWTTPFFHRDFYVPPLAPGYPAGTFLDIAESHLRTLQPQLSLLARAGRWMAEARSTGHRIWAVACGHSYPTILELPEDGSYPIEWGRNQPDLHRALPRDLTTGDVAIHLGYRPADVSAIMAVLKRGIRLIHTSPYGRPVDLPDHEDFIWLDLPWRPGDACVDVPGYSVRILPMSSTCQTMAYFAILSEMADSMGWE